MNVVQIFDLIVNLWLGYEMIQQKIWEMLLMNGSAGIRIRAGATIVAIAGYYG
jgi:hypothetical protein